MENKNRFEKRRIDRSCYLTDAVSIYAELHESGMNDLDIEDNMYRVSKYMTKDFTQDVDNDIWVNENGAVLDAYVIDRDVEINELLYKLEEIVSHPGYNVEVKKGRFPIDMMGDSIVYSTHVAYVTNYKELLENKKEKVK